MNNATNTSVTDQMKRLENKVTVAGRVKSVGLKSTFYNTDDDGVNNISTVMEIYANEDETVDIRCNVKVSDVYKSGAKKGQHNPAYDLVKDIVDAFEEDEKAQKFVRLQGQLVDNPYWDTKTSAIVRNATRLFMTGAYEFKGTYESKIVIEGFIKEINDKMYKDEYTGEKTVRFITRDWKNLIDTNFYITEENYNHVQDMGVGEGDTVIFTVKWVPKTRVKEAPSNVKRWGDMEEARVVFADKMIVGCELRDGNEEDQLDEDLVTKALKERKLRVDALEAELAAKNGSGFVKTTGLKSSVMRDSAKPAPKKVVKSEEEEDSAPFDEDNGEEMDF